MRNIRKAMMTQSCMAAIVVVTVAGCTAGPNESDLPAFTIATIEGVAEEAGDQALLEGTLEERDGCLAVSSPEHIADPVIPIFPKESVVNEGSSTYFVDFYEVRIELKPGERVSLGGGWSSEESLVASGDCPPGAQLFRVHVAQSSP